MPVRLAKIEVPANATIKDELEILANQSLELEETMNEYSDALGSAADDRYISKTVQKQLITNAEELQEDCEKAVTKAKQTKNIVDVRQAMGMLEASIEILTKPVVPEE